MSALAPWKYVRSIDSIDLHSLKKAGFSCILFDRDNTVLPYGERELPAEIKAWLDEARGLGFRLCMVSNNFHTKQVEASAAELGVEVIHHAMKPFPFSLWAGCKRMGVKRSEALMVGDQIFTDVLAGRLSGVKTALVMAQSKNDLWYTKILRKIERHILKDLPLETK